VAIARNYFKQEIRFALNHAAMCSESDLQLATHISTSRFHFTKHCDFILNFLCFFSVFQTLASRRWQEMRFDSEKIQKVGNFISAKYAKALIIWKKKRHIEESSIDFFCYSFDLCFCFLAKDITKFLLKFMKMLVNWLQVSHIWKKAWILIEIEINSHEWEIRKKIIWPINSHLCRNPSLEYQKDFRVAINYSRKQEVNFCWQNFHETWQSLKIWRNFSWT